MEIDLPPVLRPAVGQLVWADPVILDLDATSSDECERFRIVQKVRPSLSPSSHDEAQEASIRGQMEMYQEAPVVNGIRHGRRRVLDVLAPGRRSEMDDFMLKVAQLRVEMADMRLSNLQLDLRLDQQGSMISALVESERQRVAAITAFEYCGDMSRAIIRAVVTQAVPEVQRIYALSQCNRVDSIPVNRSSERSDADTEVARSGGVTDLTAFDAQMYDLFHLDPVGVWARKIAERLNERMLDFGIERHEYNQPQATEADMRFLFERAMDGTEEQAHMRTPGFDVDEWFARVMAEPLMARKLKVIVQ